ncbi:MAG TPA: ATP-binding cassette domain-containing protein [Polyangiales bacterium]|nr:ATP-binding cassette domain-containing protein [Polyangiales bacterium]
MTSQLNRNLLSARRLGIDAQSGRTLFADLSLSLAARDRVALVGRNGVGKSALLEVLAGLAPPQRGSIQCHGRRVLVPQLLPSSTSTRSPGERRRQQLRAAFDAAPELLLLDEPSHDLDDDNLEWLLRRLADWPGALVIVSHDPRLLPAFCEFFVAAESGCRHFSGSFEQLVASLQLERDEGEQRYVRTLQRLHDDEQHNATLRRRRQRKKNLGRLHELKRCPSRAVLNAKRSYKQVSQGKRAVLQAARIGAAREWTRATRRALSVELPLRLASPELPAEAETAIATLQRASLRAGDRTLFEDLSLQLRRQRMAVIGPNGSGKTSLLEILVGERRPSEGRAICDPSRIGYIAQDASNFRRDESLLECLAPGAEAVALDALAVVLRAHEFPFALAERSLRSLSPGERLRAALIELWQRRPIPELLVLDEPTDHLDLLGAAALSTVLRRWPGGLVVASHSRSLLVAIGVDGYLDLGRSGLRSDEGDESSAKAVRFGDTGTAC